MRESGTKTDDGFSLLELLIAMTIAVVVLGAMVGAMIAAFDVTGTASTTLSATDDRQLVEVWLPRDVQSAQSAFTGVVNPPCVTAQGQTGTAALELTGQGETVIPQAQGEPTTSTDSFEADYIVEGKAGGSTGQRLVRYYCDWPAGASQTSCTGTGVTCTALTISFDLCGTFASPCPTGASAASATLPSSTTVTLTMTDTSGNTYSVSGTERS